MGVEVGLTEPKKLSGNREFPARMAAGSNWFIINTDMRVDPTHYLSEEPEIDLLITDVPNLPEMPYSEIEFGLNKYKPKKAVICAKEKLDLDYNYIYFTHDDYRRYPLYFICSNIFLHTDEEDLVFDPFSGYSTAGICALDMHRRYYGVEINPLVYKIARKKLQEWQSR